MTFRNVLETVKRGNADRLKAKAQAASTLVSITQGSARRVLFDLQSRAVAQLVEMRMALVGEVLLEDDVIVGVWFRDGGGSHVRFRDLSPAAQTIVLHEIETRLPRVGFTNFPIHQENSHEITQVVA